MTKYSQQCSLDGISAQVSFNVYDIVSLETERHMAFNKHAPTRCSRRQQTSPQCRNLAIFSTKQYYLRSDWCCHLANCMSSLILAYSLHYVKAMTSSTKPEVYTTLPSEQYRARTQVTYTESGQNLFVCFTDIRADRQTKRQTDRQTDTCIHVVHNTS